MTPEPEGGVDGPDVAALELLRTRALGGIGQDDGTLITAKDCAVILALLDRLAAVTAQRDQYAAQVARVEALFSGGPDTVCRTTWPVTWAGRIECVEVPLDDLRAALRADGGGSQ